VAAFFTSIKTCLCNFVIARRGVAESSGVSCHREIIDATSVSAFFVRLYDYAWFVGFAIAFAIYLALRGLSSEIKRDASTHSTFAQGRLSLSMTKE